MNEIFETRPIRKIDRSQTPPGWRNRVRWTRWLLVLAVFLVALRIALPYIVKAYANHELNKPGDYSGRIGDVSMRLWRGGYRLHHIQILRKTAAGTAPLFSASEVDLLIEWKEIFHGSLVGQVIMNQPRVNFVSSTNASANGGNESWGRLVQSLFPFDLNRVEIDNGEIHFQNPAARPPVDIYLSKISATATNLTNAREVRQKLPSGLTASGSTIGGGLLTLQLQMNVLKDIPTYQINCGLTNVDLVALNSFLQAYGKFDVERGRFAFFTSVASDSGNYQGYLKVFFNNLDVFQWEKDRKKNILQIFWQAIVAGVTEVLKNHPKDQLATKIPISGSYSGSSVGLWTATGTLLENAFIRALVPKLDQPVTVEQVDQSAGK